MKNRVPSARSLRRQSWSCRFLPEQDSVMAFCFIFAFFATSVHRRKVRFAQSPRRMEARGAAISDLICAATQTWVGVTDGEYIGFTHAFVRSIPATSPALSMKRAQRTELLDIEALYRMVGLVPRRLVGGRRPEGIRANKVDRTNTKRECSPHRALVSFINPESV